ncbi:3'-5' exonuclease [Methanofollis ethanolicus]|uniref:3'-5' exonuclease n=1 Tax=Methanofollis ethanolicus TaxID=488124 RepID=UPI00082A6C3B|nr:3'-5' exonuclease [Methanofollis ethanolicus]
MSSSLPLDGNVLVIDTETTGRFLSGRPPPRLVELAWVLCDSQGFLLAEHAMTVVPEGFSIPPSAVKIHGITTVDARRDGIRIRDALINLAQAAKRSDWVVAHNLAYDRRVVAEECERAGCADPLEPLRGWCTMVGSARYCGIRRQGGYKWPTLSELHQVLFGRPYDGAHRAREDARACARCFFALAEAGEVKKGG